jgi:hypothetical protein
MNVGRRHIFGRKIFFGNMPNFGEKDLLLYLSQQVVGKKHVEKEGKETCRRKINVTRMKTR